MPYIVSKRLAVVLIRWTKVLPNFNIYIALDSHYRAILVIIVIVEQTSGTGIMEYFLDILRKGYIVLCNILQGNYTIVEAIGSYTRVGIEAYI